MKLVVNLYFKVKYVFKNLFAQRKIKRGCFRMFFSLCNNLRFFYFYNINFIIPRTCTRIDKNVIKIQIRTLHNYLLIYFFKFPINLIISKPYLFKNKYVLSKIFGSGCNNLINLYRIIIIL
jgi:hypothetical protein